MTTIDSNAHDESADESANPQDPIEMFLESAQRPRDPRRLPGLVGRAVRLAWQASRVGVLGAGMMQVVGALAGIALVVIGQSAIETIIGIEPGSGDLGGLTVVVVALAVVAALSSAASTFQQQQQRLLSEEVEATVWRRLLDVTGRVRLEFFESPRFYDQLQRIKTNAVVRPSTVTTAVFGLLGGGVGLAGLLVVLVSIEPLLLPLLFLGAIPTMVLSRRASRTEFGFARAMAPRARARDYLRDVLTGRDESKEIRAFGSERALRSRHDDRSAEYLTTLRLQVRRRQRYAAGGVATSAIALGLSMGLLVAFLAVGRISIAEAAAAALGIRLLSSRMDQLMQGVSGLFESSVFLDDLERFLRLVDVGDEDGAGQGPALHERIAVKDVSFTYPGSDKPVLQDVDLEIGAGQVVALVGENGSGKTTLAKLIAGLYAPTSGRISWDNVNVDDLLPADVRRSVAVIFQDFVRYRLTAQENIGLGDARRINDEEAVREAARVAGAESFLTQLPHGFDTILSKEYALGHDLSVGQWQRVALARALYRDSPLVILDEPSSALDPRAEQELFSDVRATLHGRSALLVSHRYSTVRSADRIYVMRRGRIVECGSHDELMGRSGLYAELFSMQAMAYR